MWHIQGLGSKNEKLDQLEKFEIDVVGLSEAEKREPEIKRKRIKFTFIAI